jgi:hypothetical protein
LGFLVCKPDTVGCVFSLNLIEDDIKTLAS